MSAEAAERALEEAREYASGALRALATFGHEDIAGEMLRRAAKLVAEARRENFLEEVLAPEIELVVDALVELERAA